MSLTGLSLEMGSLERLWPVTLKWDCGLHQIQKEVQKFQILVIIDQKFHADDENTLELLF
jgi:hypothetical protein